MWIYLLKVNIAIVLFLGIYRWLYRNDTFFRLRRYVLLSMLATAFLYPVIDLSLWIRQNEVLSGVAEVYTSMIPDLVITPSTQTTVEIDWSMWITCCYGAVALLFVFRLLRQLCLVVMQRYRSVPFRIDGKKVYRLQSIETPHSFFHWIFLWPTQYKESELKEIVEHEMIHASQHHTVDLLLSELIAAICWINPLVWTFRQEIRKNLEFIADSEVIDKGYDARLYQYHLLGMAQHPSAMAICNNMNVSPLKERIIMLNKKRSKKMKLVAYSLLLPVAVAFALANSATLVAAGTETVTSTLSTVVEEIAVAAQQPQQSPRKILTLADKMPAFPGGDKAMVEFIRTNTRYPQEAKTNGVKGKVVCSFTVETDGSVTEVAILRGVDPQLDAEAIRVLNQMPKWTPAEHKGQKVAVKYNVSVNFPPSTASDQAKSNNSETSKTDKDGNVIYNIVDEMPKYPGGEGGMLQFISKNTKYPVDAFEKGIEGRVICSFVITETGDVTDIQIKRSIDKSLDKEAMRVIKLFGKWTPGKLKGVPVRVNYLVPIQFRLAPKTPETKAATNKTAT